MVCPIGYPLVRTPSRSSSNSVGLRDARCGLPARLARDRARARIRVVKLLTVYTIVIAPRHRVPPLNLPLELPLDADVTATVTSEEEALLLRVRRRVNPADLATVPVPGGEESEGEAVPPVRLVLDPDQKPESALSANIVSAVAILTGVPLSLLHHVQEDRFVAEDADDAATLERLGTDLPQGRTLRKARSSDSGRGRERRIDRGTDEAPSWYPAVRRCFEELVCAGAVS